MSASEKVINRAEITSDNRLALSGQWVVQEATRLHNELLSLEPNTKIDGKPTAIDCRPIESLDLAGIQLVLATRKSIDATLPIELDAETSASSWFGLCGVGEPVFDFA